jgi:hypothetical protein
MKKLFFNSILVIILLAGCEEESIVKNNLQFEEEAEKEASSNKETNLKSTNANSIYFMDWLEPGSDPSGEGFYPPEEYYINCTANWYYNAALGTITATGTVDAHFETMYGDVGDANSFIKIQFFLAKDSTVFDNNITQIWQTNGVKGEVNTIDKLCDGGYRDVQEESATDSRTFSVEFTIDNDLRDVTIVSQGYMFGCFNHREDCRTVSLSYANDKDVLIDNTIPGTVFIINAIENISVNENTTYTSVTPSLSGDVNGNVTYALGGADASKFTINTTTGIVSMVARNYEDPDDADEDNVYELYIIATDEDENFDVEALAVTINDVTEIANFSINKIANTNVDENNSYTSDTPDLIGDEPIGNVTYTKSGADAEDFAINAETGIVSMIARDYENPVDANTDNVYEVTITATDEDGNSNSESWTVTINNLNPPLPRAPRNVTIDSGSITISWDSALDAVSYNVYRQKDQGDEILIATTTSTSYMDYTVLPMPNTHMYIYRVESENDSGVSILKSKPVKTFGDDIQ